MSLPAAMALSGLNEEQFGSELKQFYDHGARLLEPLNTSVVQQYHSAYCSMSNEQRSESLATGLASLPSAGSGSSTSSSADTYWDFLTQLDQVKLEQLKPRKLYPLFPSWPPPEGTAVSEQPPPRQLVSTPTPEPVLKYGNRDLLELGTHLRCTDSWNLRPAVLPDVTIVPRIYLLANRSQYSRVYNDFLSPKRIETCSATECKFETPYYGK